MNIDTLQNKNICSLAAVYFFLFTLASITLLQSAWCMDGGALKDIIFEDTGDGFKVDIRTDGPIDDYRPACLLSPSRMVIDLVGNWKNPGKTVYETGNGVLEKIIVGEHPDKLRIVMHLQGNKRLDPIISKSENGLILTAPSRLIEDLGGEEYLTKKRVLKSIAPQDTTDLFGLVLAADEPIIEHKSFIAEGDLFPSLIIDLPGSWDYPGAPVIQIETDFVDVVRIGEHKEFIRIAIDFMISGPFIHEVLQSPEGLSISVSK